MNTPFDPHTSAVESILHERAKQAPPPALRTQVLASVDTVLTKKVPATTYGNASRRHRLGYADVVAGTFLTATAVSVLIVALLSGEAASHRLAAVTKPPLLSFAQRAEAAGITLDTEPPSQGHVAVGQPHDTALQPRANILHSLDARSSLQGDL